MSDQQPQSAEQARLDTFAAKGITFEDQTELNIAGIAAHRQVSVAVNVLSQSYPQYSGLLYPFLQQYSRMLLASPRGALKYRFGAFDTGVEFFGLMDSQQPATLIGDGFAVKHYWQIPLGTVLVEDYFTEMNVPTFLGFNHTHDLIGFRRIRMLGFDLLPRNQEPLFAIILFDHFNQQGVISLPQITQFPNFVIRSLDIHGLDGDHMRGTASSGAGATGVEAGLAGVGGTGVDKTEAGGS